MLNASELWQWLHQLGNSVKLDAQHRQKGCFSFADNTVNRDDRLTHAIFRRHIPQD
jgi:hypothetical protein